MGKSTKPVAEAPARAPAQFDKATILGAKRWKAKERLALAVALDDKRKYTMAEAKKTLDAMLSRQVRRAM